MENKKGIEEMLKIEGYSLTKDTVLVSDDNIYRIDLFPDNLDDPNLDLDEGIAYLKDDYYYAYKGIANMNNLEGKSPGIYKNRDGKPKYFIIEPETEEEKKTYNAMMHLVSLNPVSIIDSANEKEEIFIGIPESTKLFRPEITENDDILKLLAKKAILVKNVDLDQCKDRFSNKNELFNFKQVLRNEKGKVSIKIFDRGMEALNLEYVIILREKSTDDIVGERLEQPIVVSSEETYNL